jgi:acetyltransferase-like isoleucine patch superfamily enzyme
MSNEATRSLIRTVLTPVLSLIALTVSPLATAVTFEEIDRFAQSDAADYDKFGVSFAIDGDTVILGAPNDDNADVDGDSNSGSAYIFVRNTAGAVCSETSNIDPWCQQAKLTASDAESGENFGSGVAISGDTATVSAMRDDYQNDDGTKAKEYGSVYIFERSTIDNTWTQTFKSRAADPSNYSQFGHHVALEGDTLAVGARRDRTMPSPDNGRYGSVYIFVRNSASAVCFETSTIDPWCQQAKLTAADGNHWDHFGNYVALDGNTLVVGSPYSDGDTVGQENTGAAYIFVRSGTIWTLQAKLTADAPLIDEWFGFRVGISGNTVILGAPQLRDEFGAGAAYIFGRSSGIWSQEDRLTTNSGFIGDGYGFNVEIAGDVAMVGANTDNELGEVDSGSVYLYTRTDAGWIEKSEKLTLVNNAAGDTFGTGLAISGDTALIVASPFKFDYQQRGSALIFSIDFDDDGYRDSIDNCPTTYNPDQTDVNSDGYGDACVDPSVTIPANSEVDPTAVIAEGTVLNSGVVIEEGVTLEADVTVNSGTSIGEDTTIEANTTLNRDVVVGSDAIIGENVIIGKDVLIGDNVTIGNDTTIGKGSHICDDVIIGTFVNIGQNGYIDINLANGFTLPGSRLVAPDCP